MILLLLLFSAILAGCPGQRTTGSQQKASSQAASNLLEVGSKVDVIPKRVTSHAMDVARAGRPLFAATNTMALGYETALHSVKCVAGSNFTDPDLGTFSENASQYCDPKCGRFGPGILCCAPMTAHMMDVKLRLKQRGQPERLVNFRDKQDRHLLTAPGRVVFIVHGWMERMSSMKWITEMRDEFSDLNENAIIVDWRKGNAVHYWQAIANTRVVGAIIGRAILNWGIADRTLVVGFSLGAHIAGEAGRFTRTQGGVLINECHGLDPAGPFYDGTSNNITLDRSDCRVVQAIHTAAEEKRESHWVYDISTRLGTYKKSGHCDFWVNCGFDQGPCVDFSFRDLIKSFNGVTQMSDSELVDYVTTRACSHWRAPQLYNSALRRKCDRVDRPIVSYPCPVCGSGSACIDKQNLPAASNTFPPFSQCSPDHDENYYLSSHAYDPHCPVDRVT